MSFVPSQVKYTSEYHGRKCLHCLYLFIVNLFISRKDNDMENHVCAIDLDEGVKLNLPLSQVRVLPPEMKSLPCQAVRVDIGLVSFGFLISSKKWFILNNCFNSMLNLNFSGLH